MNLYPNITERRELQDTNPLQKKLLRMYIGELKGLKVIGREIGSDPRTFKHQITSLGIKVPFPGSIWTKTSKHLKGDFDKPIPKWFKEIIIGSLLGDAQLRLQSKTKAHFESPSNQEYKTVLCKTNILRRKIREGRDLTHEDIQHWNLTVNLLKRTNTANFWLHKSIFEIEWIKFLGETFRRFLDFKAFVKPIKYIDTKWTCGFDTVSSVHNFNIWKNWYSLNNKKVPKRVPSFHEVTPNILLHWYVDDGYFSANEIGLCSFGFTVKENKYLLEQLAKNNIKGRLYYKSAKPFISISIKKPNKRAFFDFMEQAKFFTDAKKIFPHKFSKSITRNDLKEHILEKYPEIMDSGIDARDKLYSELK